MTSRAETRADASADTHADEAADETRAERAGRTGRARRLSHEGRARRSSREGRVRRMPRPAEVLLLLALPVALAAATFSLRDANGPYWFSSNLDPSYPYLLNSLNVANLRRPAHTDHPGTTVQLTGAALIRLLNPSADEEATARAVLTEPESYIRKINSVLIIVCALCLFAAGWLASAGGGDVLTGLLAQTPPFLFLSNLVGLVGLRPESFLLALSVLLGGAALAALGREARPREARRCALAFGVIVGLGLATKLTFAPLVLLPLALLPTWRSRALMALAALAAFLLAVSPILSVEQPPDAFRLVAGVATRTGFHAHGAVGPLGFKQYAWSGFNLVTSNLVFSGVVAAGLIVLALDFKRLLAGDLRHRALAAACVAQAAQLLVVATYPNSLYLVPAAGLLGCNVALTYQIARGRFGLARPKLFHATLLLVAALVAFSQLAELRTLRRRALDKGEWVQALRRRLAEEFGAARLVEYWGASSPSWALKFGLEWNGERYAGLVEELHPGRLFYNPWTLQFSTYDRPVEADRLKGAGDSFVMYGFSFDNEAFRRRLPTPFLPGGLTLENTTPRAPRVETIYKARFGEQARAADATDDKNRLVRQDDER